MGNLVKELRELGDDCCDNGKRICNLAADMIERMSAHVINNALHGCDGCKERDMEIERLEAQLERSRSELAGMLYAAAGAGR